MKINQNWSLSSFDLVKCEVNKQGHKFYWPFFLCLPKQTKRTQINAEKQVTLFSVAIHNTCWNGRFSVTLLSYNYFYRQ